MPKTFVLACYVCEFRAPDAEAFATHVVATGHTIGAEQWADLKTGGDAGFAELIAGFERLLESLGGASSEDVEISPVDIDEELADPDVPEEAKAVLRSFLARREAGKRGGA